MNQLARTLELAGLFEAAQLEEAKDPAASILASLAAAVRTLGFTKDSAADTPGVKRTCSLTSPITQVLKG